MAFVKVVKNKSYFKRYQVKYRRRREAKTDFEARRKLVINAKDKYGSHKYRMVVRKTNTKIICQIIYSSIKHDNVVCQANSDELKKFGLTAGLTNYAASYCTGLLLARRLLAKYKLDTVYQGIPEPSGTYMDLYKDSKIDPKHKPFKACLDVGLVRATTGNRAFGALKGAVDGGLYVPHSDSRFPGFDKKVGKLDAKVHRDRIYGKHVQEYMNAMSAENQEEYKKHFSQWIKCLEANKSVSLEDLYKKLHKEIREKPQLVKATRAQAPVRKFVDDKKTIVETSKGKYLRERRRTLAERKEAVKNKILKEMERKQAAQQ